MPARELAQSPRGWRDVGLSPPQAPPRTAIPSGNNSGDSRSQSQGLLVSGGQAGRERVQDRPVVIRCWGAASGGDAGPRGSVHLLVLVEVVAWRGDTRRGWLREEPPAHSCAHTHLSMTLSLSPGPADLAGGVPGDFSWLRTVPSTWGSPGGYPSLTPLLMEEHPHPAQEIPELHQRQSRACPPQPRHPQHPPCGDVPRLAAPWRRRTCRGGRARPKTCRPPPPPCTPPRLGV